MRIADASELDADQKGPATSAVATPSEGQGKNALTVISELVFVSRPDAVLGAIWK